MKHQQPALEIICCHFSNANGSTNTQPQMHNMLPAIMSAVGFETPMPGTSRWKIIRYAKVAVVLMIECNVPANPSLSIIPAEFMHNDLSKKN